MKIGSLVIAALVAAAGLGAVPALSEQVTVSGSTVYVTRNDCMTLTQHRPDASVTYQPGVDVHGRHVAPADVDGGQQALIGNSAGFNVVVNPLSQAGAPAPGGADYGNTQMPVARVDVDLRTGETFINGRPLSSTQDRIVLDACRRAGYR